MTYTHDYLLRADECDRNLFARPASINNLLQEAAGFHAVLLKVGMDDLKPQNLTWMLLRFTLNIARCPRWRDTLRIVTWPSGTRGRLCATREYAAFILPDETAPFLTATSEWGLVDIREQRLVRITDEIRSLRTDDTPPSPPLPRIPEIEKSFLTPNSSLLTVRTFPVRESQIDFNQHVNNSHYIAWILDTLPANLPPASLARLDIAYRLPANIGDTLRVHTRHLPETNTCLHAILRESDNAQLIHAQTTWQPMANKAADGAD